MTSSAAPSGSGGDVDRPRIVSVSKFMPYGAIAHAGGQYVQLHDDALVRFASVEHVVPDNADNRIAISHPTRTVPGTLLRGVGPGGSGRFSALMDLESAWSRSAVALPYRRLFSTERGPWDLLRSADAIELHWSEMIALAPLLRSRLPSTPLIGIAHDVISQRWERAAAAETSLLRRAAYAMAARRSVPGERLSFAVLDRLLVFSRKDAELAARLSPAARIEVVHPGLGPSERSPRLADPAQPIVLFTGALSRNDNWRSAMWFISEIWPSVVARVPTARLVLAGAQPPPQLTALVERTVSAELTGFVESLEPYYSRATVFVAPLLSGAGVKFKTVDAMLRGVPVIATSVGAEGIEAEDLFARITDDPTDFGDAVVSVILDGDGGRAEDASRWADSVYGRAAFAARIRDIYSSVLPRSGPLRGVVGLP